MTLGSGLPNLTLLHLHPLNFSRLTFFFFFFCYLPFFFFPSSLLLSSSTPLSLLSPDIALIKTGKSKSRKEKKKKQMCPLRLILIFLSATLAGFFVLKKLNSTTSDDPLDDSFTDAEPADDSASGFSKVSSYFSSDPHSMILSLIWDLMGFSDFMGSGGNGNQVWILDMR